MPISILGLSRLNDGSQKTLKLDISQLDDIELLNPVTFDVKLTKISHESFDAHVTGNVVILLNCNRCLKKYQSLIKLNFHALYSDDPSEDEWPIDKNDIDVEETIRQEILFGLPLQQICSEKCSGIKSNKL